MAGSSAARPRSEFTGIGAVIENVTVREVQACLVKSLVFPIYSRILSPLEKASSSISCADYQLKWPKLMLRCSRKIK